MFYQYYAKMKKYNGRPFPWCMAPDWFWFAWGLVMLLTISVPGLSLVLVTEASAYFFRKITGDGPGLKAYNAVRDLVLAIAQAAAKVMLIDKRDYSFLPWTFFNAIWVPALCYIAYKRHVAYGFEFGTMLIYHLLRHGPKYRLFAHHHVLIHKEGHAHKGLFKGPFVILNKLNSMWNGFFYGSMVYSYDAGHNKIHHRWHNDADDVHSNIDMDRSRFSSYILWLPRFTLYWCGVSCLALFLKRTEYRLAAQILFGQLWWALGMALVIKHAGVIFCLAYFVYPMVESTAFLGSMAYLWHAFVEPTDPTNQYINSITILNGKDNIWNEDYHVVHHHAPFVHWSDCADFYKKTESHYKSCTATIFRDCEEGELIYWIFSAKWDTLAEHFVDLNDKLNHEEKKELLLRRLRFYRDGGFHNKTQSQRETEDLSTWGTSDIRDWDTTSKEEQEEQRGGGGEKKEQQKEETLAEVIASEKKEKEAAGEKQPSEIPVGEYFDIMMDVIDNGGSFGEPWSHYAPRFKGQYVDSALDRHETFLALQGRFTQSNQKILDIGCSGEGRAMRNISRLSGCGFPSSSSSATSAASAGSETENENNKNNNKVIAVCNNSNTIARSKRYDLRRNLIGHTGYCESSLDSFSDKVGGAGSCDGAYTIEGLKGQAPAKKLACFKEVFKCLKPGASFVGYDWVLTSEYSDSNEKHRSLKNKLELLDSNIKEIQTVAALLASLKEAGFEVVDNFDVSDQLEQVSTPWYGVLEGNWNSLWGIQTTPAGRSAKRALTNLFETIRVAPKGSSESMSQTEDLANSLVEAGKLGIVSPTFFFHAKKPSSSN